MYDVTLAPHRAITAALAHSHSPTSVSLKPQHSHMLLTRKQPQSVVTGCAADSHAYQHGFA